jgi:hypothetical protein
MTTLKQYFVVLKEKYNLEQYLKETIYSEYDFHCRVYISTLDRIDLDTEYNNGRMDIDTFDINITKVCNGDMPETAEEFLAMKHLIDADKEKMLQAFEYIKTLL